MEQGQSLANWMIWLRNLRILENFLGLALAKSISFTKRGKSLGHLSSFRSTGIQAYDSMMKFWESTLFLTNHSTTDQSNVISLVERVLNGQNFCLPAYACMLMVRKEYRRTWLNKKKYDERTLQLGRQVFFCIYRSRHSHKIFPEF